MNKLTPEQLKNAADNLLIRITDITCRTVYDESPEGWERLQRTEAGLKHVKNWIIDTLPTLKDQRREGVPEKIDGMLVQYEKTVMELEEEYAPLWKLQEEDFQAAVRES